MQDLDSSLVHRNLETKLKIGGLEALDFLAVLIFAAVMSLFFGSGTMGFIFVFILPLILLITLYFIKRNRPDGYLVNLFRFMEKTKMNENIERLNLLASNLIEMNKNVSQFESAIDNWDSMVVLEFLDHYSESLSELHDEVEEIKNDIAENDEFDDIESDSEF